MLSLYYFVKKERALWTDSCVSCLAQAENVTVNTTFYWNGQNDIWSACSFFALHWCFYLFVSLFPNSQCLHTYKLFFIVNVDITLCNPPLCFNIYVQLCPQGKYKKKVNLGIYAIVFSFFKACPTLKCCLMGRRFLPFEWNESRLIIIGYLVCLTVTESFHSATNATKCNASTSPPDVNVHHGITNHFGWTAAAAAAQHTVLPARFER